MFLKQFGGIVAAGAGALCPSAAEGSGNGHPTAAEDHVGVLVDLTECIGCRRCEYACRKANGIDAGAPEDYDDQSVFARHRRPSPDAFTVVNAFHPNAGAGGDEKPVYAKINCMHCNHPACASACIVGALQKQEDGAVTYDAWKCIGCRYCMVACPFQLPAYSYDDVLTPEVRKCQLCFADRTSHGRQPACAEECPRNVMRFGKRRDLLELAHARIQKHPDRYVNHVYGEHEIGGTAWLYLSAIPFEEVGFQALGSAAPPALTEAIQHGVFKYWIAPVGWCAFLSTMYWLTGRRAHAKRAHHANVLPESVEMHAPSGGTGCSQPVSHTSTEYGLQASRAPQLLTSDGSAVALAEAPPVPNRITTELEPLDGGNGNGKHHHARDHDELHDRDDHPHAAPVDHKLMTPGVWVLLAIVLVGTGFGLYRFIVGLAASTNLDQQHPWGLWIAMDVGSGIALAGGGFVAAAVIHIFHREHYHALARSALLTALLGYTFYVPGLLADIGRWYNIWHPTIPAMWQGNSVLFEVGLCVMIYLNVQYVELTPIICERLLGVGWMLRYPKLRRLVQFTHDVTNRIMPALLILGVALSTFHQSSLGNLMVIAPYKLHHLWWSPLSPLLFLLSAMMVGFPMVIFTILFASWCLNRKPEMEALTPLAGRYVPVFVSLYLIVKIGDVIWRGAYGYLDDRSFESILWLIEVIGGVILPLAMLCFPRIRASPKWLAITCLTIIMGVVLNRLNVFVLAYHPPYAEKSYFPSITEFAVSMGLVAALLLVYRVAVTYLPVLEPRPRVREHA